MASPVSIVFSPIFTHLILPLSRTCILQVILLISPHLFSSPYCAMTSSTSHCPQTAVSPVGVREGADRSGLVVARNKVEQRLWYGFSRRRESPGQLQSVPYRLVLEDAMECYCASCVLEWEWEYSLLKAGDAVLTSCSQRGSSALLTRDEDEVRPGKNTLVVGCVLSQLIYNAVFCFNHPLNPVVRRTQSSDWHAPLNTAGTSAARSSSPVKEDYFLHKLPKRRG